MTTKIKVRGTIVKVIAGVDYAQPGHTLVKVKSSGNGFIIKFPKWKSTEQDYYVCLDYAQAAYLYEALKEYDKMGGYFEDD